MHCTHTHRRIDSACSCIFSDTYSAISRLNGESVCKDRAIVRSSLKGFVDYFCLCRKSFRIALSPPPHHHHHPTLCFPSHFSPFKTLRVVQACAHAQALSHPPQYWWVNWSLCCFLRLTLACWGGLTCLEDGVLRNESYTMWCNTAEQIWIMGQWTMRSSQGWGHKSRGAVVQHSISYQWRKLQQGSHMQHCLRAWFNKQRKEWVGWLRRLYNGRGFLFAVQWHCFLHYCLFKSKTVTIYQAGWGMHFFNVSLILFLIFSCCFYLYPLSRRIFHIIFFSSRLPTISIYDNNIIPWPLLNFLLTGLLL